MLPVHHVAVLVEDLDRAEAFYGAVLGLPLLKRHQDQAGAPRSVWLSLANGAFLAIEKAMEARRPVDEEPGWHVVALGIEPSAREFWRAKLAAAGSPVERETAFTLYARDPDGNLIALSHYPDATGAV